MARPSYSVSGKTVLITGAARGIGAACAHRLATQGARVALVGLEPDELERVAATCGPSAVWFEADVTDSDDLDRAVEGTVEALGGIDVAIANAGVAPVGMVRSIDPATFERTIEINLLGVWRTARACLPHVIERRGYVLLVASMAAALHLPGMSAYAASKAGVEAFGDSLRMEVEHLGVGVGVGYFSWIATEMVSGADEHPVAGFMRGLMKGPFAKTYPVSAAADGVSRGIERRARRVVVPGWARAMLAARDVIGPLAERDIRDQIADADARAQADLAERGAEAASAPVGRGGRAVAERDHA